MMMTLMVILQGDRGFDGLPGLPGDKGHRVRYSILYIVYFLYWDNTGILRNIDTLRYKKKINLSICELI